MNSDDEDGLPPIRPELAVPPHASTAAFRKRSRGNESTTSSEAPFFSSDDLAEASVDNYDTPRPKKQHRRKWWETSMTQSPIKRDLSRLAKRAQDSGVFMSSDSSSNDDGFGVEGLKIGSSLKRPGLLASALPKSPKRLKPLSGEPLAKSVITRCIEANAQVVELSNFHLETLSNETLRPLRDLISLPRTQHRPETEDAYQSFTSQLKLFLAVNRLRRVPGELVMLSNLTVLSLRNNLISELPHSIGRLHNLIELNVATNKLRYLPWELLGLVRRGKLVNLHLRPNPLFHPIEPTPGRFIFGRDVPGAQQALALIRADMEMGKEGATLEHKLRIAWIWKIQSTLLNRMLLQHANEPPLSPRRSWSNDGTMRHSPHHGWKKEPIYLGSTPITYYDFDGSVPRSSHPAPSRLSANVTIVPVSSGTDVKPRDCRAERTVQVPSLFELAARACGESLILTNMDECLPAETPTAVLRILDESCGACDEGGRQCSVCQRTYVVPGAEWIEYWHCAPDSFHFQYEELFLPFLRRSCSWACADIAAEGRDLEMAFGSTGIGKDWNDP